MVRAIIWACVGFFICLGMDCPIPLAFVVTVVTTVIGCLDFHPGEYVAGSVALVALFVMFRRMHVTPLDIAIAVTPVVAMAGLLAWFLITNPSRSRKYKAMYASSLPGRRPASTRMATGPTEAAGPVRLTVEHHHYHHIDLVPPVAAPELPAGGKVIPFRPRADEGTIDQDCMQQKS